MNTVRFLIWMGLVLVAGSCAGGLSGKEGRKAGATCESGRMSVAFYNVENLFDTLNDTVTNDDDFTPEGKQAWDDERYQSKLTALASVIDTIPGELPAILGLCEVENGEVLEQWISAGTLSHVPYSIVHKDSPDERGIDVALLYRQDRATLLEAEWLYVALPDSSDRTRDILYAVFLVGGEELAVYVNHWPSRSGGQERSEPGRLAAAETLVAHRLSQLSKPERHVLVMGDFNDYPGDKSLQRVTESTGMVNLMAQPELEGLGSYNYRGSWGFLDQIVVSEGLMDGQGLDITNRQAHVLQEPFMLYTNPESGEQRPSRTYGGTQYYGGYSDHLPVYVVLHCKP